MDQQARWNLNARVPRAQGALALDGSQCEYCYIKVGYFELILGSLHAILVPRVLSFFFTHGQFVTTEAERV